MSGNPWEWPRGVPSHTRSLTCTFSCRVAFQQPPITDAQECCEIVRRWRAHNWGLCCYHDASRARFIKSENAPQVGDWNSTEPSMRHANRLPSKKPTIYDCTRARLVFRKKLPQFSNFLLAKRLKSWVMNVVCAIDQFLTIGFAPAGLVSNCGGHRHCSCTCVWTRMYARCRDRCGLWVVAPLNGMRRKRFSFSVLFPHSFILGRPAFAPNEEPSEGRKECAECQVFESAYDTCICAR